MHTKNKYFNPDKLLSLYLLYTVCKEGGERFMEYVITTNELSKTYAKAKKPALSNVNLSIEKGEIFGLLGPNGAGKSTLTLLLTTLTKPSSGDGLVGGHSIVSAPDKVRSCLGYCPQKASLDEELTAWENMILYAQLAGLARRKAKKCVEELLEEAGLTLLFFLVKTIYRKVVAV